MQYNQLITDIQADIYSNGAELITGDILQNVLVAMVGALSSAGACYKGTITPASAAPLDLDQATVYLALTAGTYTNFVDSNNDPIVTTGPALIIYDGGPSLVFSKTDLPFATTSDLPWRSTVTPDEPYLDIFLNDGCVLAIDSVGYNTFHGIVCVDNVEGISSAVFIGWCDIDTSQDVKIGRNGDNDLVLEIATNAGAGSPPITVTCLNGTAPDHVEYNANSEIDLYTITGTHAWTNLEAGGGGGGDEQTSNKKTDIASNRTSETYYPNTKGVFDLTSKWGVISQTQTWSGSGSQPRTYVMSDLVYGAIPQANIDLFEAAGAVFNETSGYFELNELTDISYEEMQVIYASQWAADYIAANGGNALRNLRKCPRTITISNKEGTPTLYKSLRPSTSGSEVSKIESIAIGNNSSDLLNVSSLDQVCYNCPYLKYIGVYGAVKPTASTSLNLAFTNCASLVGLRITGLNASLQLASQYFSAQVDKTSIIFLIENALTTPSIVITLSATLFAEYSADADVTAALAAHTNVTLASA